MTPFEVGADEKGDVEQFLTSELVGVVERPRLLSSDGLWATLVALDVKAGERVVISVRPRASLDDLSMERVLEAVAAGRRFRHPAVLPVRRFGRTERLLWISVPELGGCLLREWFSEERSPLPAVAIELLHLTVPPLMAIHEAGLAHGALTLSAFHRDATGEVRVCCPGVDLALLRGDLRNLRRGMATETLPLAAPEVEAGQEVDAATDQYALAAILVKATSGRAPTRGEELPSEVPDHWLPALRRALNPDPAARWGSVRELAEALEPGRRRDAGLWTGATAGPDDFPILLPPAFEKEGGEGEGGEREGGDGEDGEGEQPWPSGPEPLRAGASWRRVAGAVLLLLMASAVAPAYVSDLGARMADLADAQVEEWGGMGAITERWRRSGAAELAAVLFEGRAAPAARLPTSAAREREREPQEPPPSSERQQAEPRRDPEPEPEVPAAPGAASGTAASWDPSPSATAYSDTEARPTGLGLLEVHSDPWASVFIDDVFVGNTPLLDVRIPAGDHVLRIERSRFDPHIRVITMEPGQELRLMDIVLTGGGR